MPCGSRLVPSLATTAPALSKRGEGRTDDMVVPTEGVRVKLGRQCLSRSRLIGGVVGLP